MADFTKLEGEILDWTLLDDTDTDNPFAETGVQSKPDEMVVDLIITVAHNDAVDAATSFVNVRVLGRLSATAEGWRQIAPFQSGGGQATGQILAAASGSGQGNPERIEVADTTAWDTGAGEMLFLKDVGTLVNSCIVLIEGWVDNDYYINAWELVNAYDNLDYLYDGLSQHLVRIPAGVSEFNVTFSNSHGTATYAVRVDYAEVTELV